MDPRLLNLVQAANSGEVLLMVNMIVGPWIVSGQPVGESQFFEISRVWVRDSIVANLPRQTRRQIESEGNYSPTLEAISQQATSAMAQLGPPYTVDAPVLNLVNASLYSGVGTVTVGCTRIPLASVGAFWVSQWKHEPVQFSGGGGGVGFSF